MDYQYDYFLQNYWITEPFFHEKFIRPCLCRICFRMERLLTNLAFLPWEHEEFIRALSLWHLLQDGDYWHIEPFFPGNMKNSSGSFSSGQRLLTYQAFLPWEHDDFIRALSLASASRRRLLTYRAFLPWEYEKFIRAWSLWHLLLTYQAFLESSSLGTWTIHQGVVSVASSSGLLTHRAFLSWEHEELIRVLFKWHLLQDETTDLPSLSSLGTWRIHQGLVSVASASGRDYWLTEPFFPGNMKNSSGPCLCGICFRTRLLTYRAFLPWEHEQFIRALSQWHLLQDYWLTEPFFPENMKNWSGSCLSGICFRTRLLTHRAFLPWEYEELIRVLSKWHLLQDGDYWLTEPFFPGNMKNSSGPCLCGICSGRRLLTYRAFLPWEHEEFIRALSLWHLLQDGEITDLPSLSSLGTWRIHQGLVSVASASGRRDYWLTEPFFPGNMKNSSGPCLCGICFRTERLLTYRAFLPWKHEEFIRALSLWHLLQDGEITDLPSLSSLGTWRIHQGLVSVASASGGRLLTYRAFLPWEHEEFIRALSLWHLLQEGDYWLTEPFFPGNMKHSSGPCLCGICFRTERLLTYRAFLPWELKNSSGPCLCGICFRTERLLTYRAFLPWEHEEFIRALSLWHLLQDAEITDLPSLSSLGTWRIHQGLVSVASASGRRDYWLTEPFFPGNMKNSSGPCLCGICFRTERLLTYRAFLPWEHEEFIRALSLWDLLQDGEITDLPSLSSLGTWRIHQGLVSVASSSGRRDYWLTEPFFPGNMKNSSGPCLCGICFRRETTDLPSLSSLGTWRIHQGLVSVASASGWRLLTYRAFLPWEHEEFIRALSLWHLLQDGDYWLTEPFFPGNMKNSSGPCLCGICFRTRLLTYRAFLPWEHEEFIRALSLWHLLQDETTDLPSLSSLGTWRIHQGLVSVASASGGRLLTYRAFLPWEHEEFIRALSLWHLLQEGDYWLTEPFFPGNMKNSSGPCLCGICFRRERLLTYRAFLPWEHEEFIRALSLWHLLQDREITDLPSLSSLGTWRIHQGLVSVASASGWSLLTYRAFLPWEHEEFIRALSLWHLLQEGDYWLTEPFFPGNMKNSSGPCLCGICFRMETTDLPSLSSLGTWRIHKGLVSVASASGWRLLTYRAFLPWEHEEFIRALSLWHLLQEGDYWLTEPFFPGNMKNSSGPCLCGICFRRETTDLPSLSSLGTWRIHQGLVSVASASGGRLLTYRAFLPWEHEEFIRALSLWHLLQEGDYWLTEPFFPGNMKNSSGPCLCGICFRMETTDLPSLSSLGTWRIHQGLVSVASASERRLLTYRAFLPWEHEEFIRALSLWHLLQDGDYWLTEPFFPGNMKNSSGPCLCGICFRMETTDLPSLSSLGTWRIHQGLVSVASASGQRLTSLNGRAGSIILLQCNMAEKILSGMEVHRQGWASGAIWEKKSPFSSGLLPVLGWGGSLNV